MLAGLIVDLGQDITKGFLARKSVDEKWKLDLLCHTFKFKVDAGPELRQKKKKRHSWFTMDVRCAAWEPITSRSDTVRWIREKYNMNKFQNKNDDAPDERKSNREERSNKREKTNLIPRLIVHTHARVHYENEEKIKTRDAHTAISLANRK